jgi:ATP-dependent DNA helicase DinG
MSLVVVDEADRLPDASQSFSEARLSLFRLQQITEKSIDILGIPLSLHAAVSALLADAEKAGRHDETQRKTSSIEGFDSNLIALRNHFKDVIDTMAPTWAGIGGNHALDSLLSDFFDAFQSLDMAADAVDARLEDPANLYVSWAPSHKYPTLSVVCADAGWRMGLLWRHHGQMEIRSVVFCSATLADPSERGIRGVSPFLRSVGVLLPSEHPEKSNPVNENLYATFSRPSFGALDFVLCDPRIPPPISEVCEDDVTFDKKWVKHATAMILKAASFGEGVLVLAKSYRDVEVFEPGLKSLGDRLLCHLRHRSFASLQQQFMDADNAVLFSPAAWEGIDMPGKIRHLVILRIPNSKPDEVRQSVRAEVMRKRGLPEHAIRAIFARESLLQTKRRLIQGMGRPIRSSSDRATVWICDPRFPLPESLKELIHPMNACKPPHRVQSLRDTIPSRFQHIFEQSRVYLKDGLIIDSEGDPV